MDFHKKRLLLNVTAVSIPVFFIVATLVSAAEGVRSFSVRQVDGAGMADTVDEPANPNDDGTADPADDARLAEAEEADVAASAETSEDIATAAQETADPQPSAAAGPLHQGITATLFWVGEDASADNKEISNSPSAWDEQWKKHYGGVDDPKKRDGFFPAKFAPKENPFYVALPYNDFDSKGDRRDDALSIIPWADTQEWKDDESICKNQWVKVVKDGKTAYAQWEDVGPFGEHDVAYVFGTAEPKQKTNKRAGIDLSPAVNDYLGLSDVDKVDWQFVAADQVPDGPWKRIVTTSQVSWK